MRRKSGIVLKIEKSRAFIIENGGNMIDIKANPEWKQGDVVVYSLPNTKYIAWISAVACLLIFFLSFYVGSYYLEPKYIISVDVNPSLELTVNSFGRVTKVMAMNQDGERVKESVSILNRTYQDAVAEIVESSVMLEYIDNGTDVTMSIVGDNNDITEEMSELITLIVAQSTTAASYDLKLECHRTNQETLEKARQMGVTAGKYYYIDQLQQLGVDVETEGCIHQSISDLKSEIQQCQGGGHGQGQRNEQEKNGHGHRQKKGGTHFAPLQ